MKDRMLSGFIAGLIGGVVLNAWNLLATYVLGFGRVRLMDFISVLELGFSPKSTGQALFSLGIHLVWTGFLGSVFAYLIPLTTSRNYLFRGWLYSSVVWILTNALATMSRLPGIAKVSLTASISSAFGATVYGLVLGYVLKRLDNPPVRT
jgi:hypothetical protein